MQALYMFMLFVLLSAGILIIAGINPFEKNRGIALSKSILKERQSRMTGKETVRLNQRFLAAIENTVTMCGSNRKIFYSLVAVAGLAGLVLGTYLFGDLLLALASGLCLLPIPYILFKVKSRWYKRNQDELLEGSMNIITNSYIGCDDILKAISDNLEKLDIQAPFSEFVAEVILVDANIKRGLRKLEQKIHNRYFSEWIDLLILSQENREYKFMLPAVIDGMNDAKRLKIEADTIMMQVWREYFISVLLSFVVVPLIKFSNAQWFSILTNTLTGKVLLLLLLISIVISLFVVMKINKPL